MPRRDVEFQTCDHVTLRGWLYTPSASDGATKLPCLVMSHGFTALKEMHLDSFAECFSSQLPLTVLVYDNRGFGASDNKEGEPRHEIVPSLQVSDVSDAITYASTLEGVDPQKIGIWGSSYSGGHVLNVAAFDRRVKAVISQVPLVNGRENFFRLVRSDFVGMLELGFAADRQGRLTGEPPTMLPVVDKDPQKPSALPTPDSWAFFSAWSAKSNWKNEVTMKSLELMRSNNPVNAMPFISPTPLLFIVGENDVLTPTDLSLAAYNAAREPKQLVILPGGHFDAYEGPGFEINAPAQVEFLKKTLCK